MSADFYIVEGDTKPDLVKQLLDADGEAIDVTGATVRFSMSRNGTVVVDNASCTVDVAGEGRVRYEWETADTASPGACVGEFEVTYAGGGIQTVPNPRKLDIEITEQIA